MKSPTRGFMSSFARANATSFPWTFGRSIENLSPTSSKVGTTNPPPFSKGYFAFSPDGDTSLTGHRSILDTVMLEEEEDLNNTRDTSEHPSKTSRSPQEDLKEQERAQRLERERALAEEGEIDWVRSGGILRDALGRRDYARTERIREELRLQAEEKRIRDQWDTYERRWHVLMSSSGPIRFEDVPWPVTVAPASVAEIAGDKVKEFVLKGLKLRGTKVTRKERLRTSMLRWHPDKLGAVVARVVEDDRADVTEGIGVVFRCLKALQDTKSIR